MSKRKGNTAELELGRWIEAHDIHVEYCRGSGSVKDRPGDMIISQEIAAECKHGNYAYLKQNERNKMWKKIIMEANEFDMVPNLIYKMNNQKWLFRIPVGEESGWINNWIEVPKDLYVRYLLNQDVLDVV